MFQKFITVFIVTAAIAFAASGLPLSSIFGAGFGSGFFNLPLIFCKRCFQAAAFSAAGT